MTAHFFSTASWSGEVKWLRALCTQMDDSIESVTLVIDYVGSWRSFPWLDLRADGWILDIQGLRADAPELFDKACLRRIPTANATLKPVLGGIIITAVIGEDTADQAALEAT